MPLGYDTAEPVDLANLTIAENFAEQVNEYCRAAAKAGARVCLSFSPVNRTALTDPSEEAVSAFFQMCNSTFLCPVISDPNAYILDSGWFYDSNFHLNSAGAVVRTCALAEDILAYLGCYEEVAYDLPEMPDSIAAAYESTAETSHFTFEAIANQTGETLGWRISGLTGSGLARTELTVPSAYEGKPVVGFTPDALSGASALEQLRLPESIESLPDGLFRECSALTQLILEHRSQPCSVTEHTFDGTGQVKVFVPSEAYAMYRDGAGCETNLWALYLDRVFPYG